MQQKGKRSPITRSKFLVIRADIKTRIADRRFKAASVAADHGVSEETVRVIRKAGTWPQFERDKQARRAHATQRSGRPIAGVAPDPVMPDETTKTLTISEYNGLMSLKDDVAELQRWKNEMYQQEIEAIATGLKPIHDEPVSKAGGPRKRSLLPWRNR